MELDEVIKMLIHKDSDGMWCCMKCDFRTNRCSVIKNHVESKHIESPGFICQYCSTTCPTRNALTMHIGRKHKTVF